MTDQRSLCLLIDFTCTCVSIMEIVNTGAFCDLTNGQEEDNGIKVKEDYFKRRLPALLLSRNDYTFSGSHILKFSILFIQASLILVVKKEVRSKILVRPQFSVQSLAFRNHNDHIYSFKSFSVQPLHF